MLLLSAALLTGCAKLGEPELINVSYDPTREFYEEYNALFTEHWRQETGKHLEIIQSHGENIDVVSTPDVGTEFIFSLPKASASNL